MTRSPPDGPMPEATFLRLVLDLARSRGWLAFHDWDPRRDCRGWPDLILIRGPKLLVLELKSQAGRVRPEQVVWLRAFTDAGVDARLVRPDDLEEIAAVLCAPLRPLRVVACSVCLSA